MRCFLAIGCPDEVKTRLVKAQESAPAYVDMKAVESENMHLTLKFLGEVEPKRLPPLVESLKKAARQPFDITLEGLGVFPNPKTARVLWGGLSAGQSDVVALAQVIDSSCSALGFPLEQRFHPHITLGRIKNVKDPDGLRRFLEINTGAKYGSFAVDSYSLMESKLTSKGPKYDMAHNFPLG
jgi:RNA 2',3'-cyclic 3'-phosphodiesterase